MKVVGRSIWDKTVFVMCDCHAELIQFTKTKDATCEFDILYYGDNKTTIKGEYGYGDKENMNEDVETSYPELELFHEVDDWVTIRRLGHFKKSKDDVVWEILLDDDSAKQLLNELETWLDNEEDEND